MNTMNNYITCPHKRSALCRCSPPWRQLGVGLLSVACWLSRVILSVGRCWTLRQ